jgi:hypothetical protein
MQRGGEQAMHSVQRTIPVCLKAYKLKVEGRDEYSATKIKRSFAWLVSKGDGMNTVKHRKYSGSDCDVRGWRKSGDHCFGRQT